MRETHARALDVALGGSEIFIRSCLFLFQEFTQICLEFCMSPGKLGRKQAAFSLWHLMRRIGTWAPVQSESDFRAILLHAFSFISQFTLWPKKELLLFEEFHYNVAFLDKYKIPLISHSVIKNSKKIESILLLNPWASILIYSKSFKY